LQQFLSHRSHIDYPISFTGYQHVFCNEFQEAFHPTIFASFTTIEENNELTTKPIEINEGEILYIGNEIKKEQRQQLLSMVQEQSRAFAWDYLDMRVIQSDMCIHHIYTNEEMRPIWQPQRHMNPTLC